MLGRKPVTTDRPHILLIDDSPEEIRPLLHLLHAQPWRISVVTEAQQGYQRALALQPDLVLLDVRMPKMSGFSVCRLLREAPATQDIPVIFLTSANDLEERLEGFSLGGVDYVLKPFEAEEVLARVRLHLQLTRRAAPASEEGSPASGDEILLRAVLRYIDENLAQLPGLAEIARSVGTHEKRLSAIFRRHLGCTVFAHVRQARLRKAQELLAGSRMSVQDIADLVGFSSACNFTTAFREQQGVTPSEFRQQALAGSGR